MYPYNHKRGQRIQTNVGGVAVDRGFVAHFQVAAASATVANTTGIHAAVMYDSCCGGERCCQGGVGC